MRLCFGVNKIDFDVFVLIVKQFASDHSRSLSRIAFAVKNKSVTLSEDRNRLVSSAYNTNYERLSIQMRSFTYTLNKKGPKTLPCGTRHRIC